MNHPRLSQELSQPISENLQKLADLFPAAVKDGALDIEALREELGEFDEIRPGDEKYELNWVGKQAAKKEAFKPLLGKTLAIKPDESKNPETTQNLYIEGDNLEALKLLRQNYYGEVKMIYIDPPYNTGKDFVYTDKFKISSEESEEEEGAVSSEGKRLVKNEKSSNRFHARWLDMIYPRLRLAKDLLREDGVIFISIDDNEISNLIRVCDEIFKEANFVSILAIENNPKGRKNSRFISTSNDFCLIYAKNISEVSFCENIPKSASDLKQDEDGRFVHSSGKRILVGQNEFNLPVTNIDSEKNYCLYYNSEKNDLLAIAEKSISDSDSNLIMSGYIKYYSHNNGYLVENTYTKSKIMELFRNEALEFKDSKIFEKNFSTTIRMKSLLTNRSYTAVIDGRPESYKIDLKTTSAGNMLKRLFATEDAVFTAPKGIGLLRLLISLLNKNEKIPPEFTVLDFFSGSASTAHAVMQLNAEDGGKRRHIMVQLPEVCDENSEAAMAGYKTIADIGRERIRRAGEWVKEELQAKREEWRRNKALAETNGEEASEETNPYVLDPDSLDIGFKAFRIEDTKINWIRKDLKGVEITFQGMGNQDALDFVPGFTDEDIVYEVMLRQSNIPLTHAISKPVSEKNGKRTYLYGESYLVCLEETVTKELIETLAALEPTPLKYFFRDSAFGKDIALKDETFRRLNAEIAKNHGAQGTAYTVEFI